MYSLPICRCGSLVDADEYNAQDDQEGACNEVVGIFFDFSEENVGKE